MKDTKHPYDDNNYQSKINQLDYNDPHSKFHTNFPKARSNQIYVSYDDPNLDIKQSDDQKYYILDSKNQMYVQNQSIDQLNKKNRSQIFWQSRNSIKQQCLKISTTMKKNWQALIQMVDGYQSNQDSIHRRLKCFSHITKILGVLKFMLQEPEYNSKVESKQNTQQKQELQFALNIIIDRYEFELQQKQYLQAKLQQRIQNNEKQIRLVEQKNMQSLQSQKSKLYQNYIINETENSKLHAQLNKIGRIVSQMHKQYKNNNKIDDYIDTLEDLTNQYLYNENSNHKYHQQQLQEQYEQQQELRSYSQKQQEELRIKNSLLYQQQILPNNHRNHLISQNLHPYIHPYPSSKLYKQFVHQDSQSQLQSINRPQNQITSTKQYSNNQVQTTQQPKKQPKFKLVNIFNQNIYKSTQYANITTQTDNNRNLSIKKGIDIKIYDEKIHEKQINSNRLLLKKHKSLITALLLLMNKSWKLTYKYNKRINNKLVNESIKHDRQRQLDSIKNKMQNFQIWFYDRYNIYRDEDRKHEEFINSSVQNMKQLQNLFRELMQKCLQSK